MNELQAALDDGDQTNWGWNGRLTEDVTLYYSSIGVGRLGTLLTKESYHTFRSAVAQRITFLVPKAPQVQSAKATKAAGAKKEKEEK